MNRFLRPACFKRHQLPILFIVFAVVLMSTGCSSQTAGKSERLPVVFEDYSSQISSERMVASIEALSESEEGRIAGFESEFQAGAYISQRFKDMGLEVSEQEFPIQAYLCTNFKISLNTGVEKELKDAMVLNYSGSTPEDGLNAEIVFVGMGAMSDYSGKSVSGKFVLIQRGGELFRTKVARAVGAGAAGAIFYDPNGENAISATLGELSDIPALCISRTDAQSILENLGSNKKASAHVVVNCISEASISKNIIGTLKSKQNPSGKTLVVGAHYDSVNTPGANDNASGVSAMIEMAKVISELKTPLNCDIQFVAFGAEEIGLLGSSTYVEHVFSDKVEKPIAMLNFDMVGCGESTGVYTATGEIYTGLKDLSSAALEKLGYTYEVGETDNSDHVPFAMSGIPSLLFENGPYEDYHTKNDKVGAIEPDAMIRVTNMGVSLCVAIGKDPEHILEKR